VRRARAVQRESHLNATRNGTRSWYAYVALRFVTSRVRDVHSVVSKTGGVCTSMYIMCNEGLLLIIKARLCPPDATTEMRPRGDISRPLAAQISSLKRRNLARIFLGPRQRWECNRAQGPDRRSAGAENQDFQLRICCKRVSATVIIYISAITHFFANFREN